MFPDEPDTYDVHGLYPPGTLSDKDEAWVVQWYPASAPNPARPASLEPFKSVAVDLAAGEQVDFVFKPPGSRKYTIATTGGSDTVLGLVEDVGGDPRYLSRQTTTAARTATQPSRTSSSKAARITYACACTTRAKPARRQSWCRERRNWRHRDRPTGLANAGGRRNPVSAE